MKVNSVVSFSPDWASSPGDTINDILRERRISLGDFARDIGQTTEELDHLLLGSTPITLALARRLEKKLGASVEFWMSRDFHYRQRIAEPVPEDTWLRDLPINDMVRFGWIRQAPKPQERLLACLKFFDVPNIAAWHRRYGTLERKFAFRTSASFESRPSAVAAWLRQGEIEAEHVRCAAWNAERFENALGSMRSLTRKKDPKSFVPELQKICSGFGVAVVIVRSPEGCRASGATRFIESDKALLLLSFRYLSDDQFWFSFFHEAGHLVLHGNRQVFIEGFEPNDSAAEREANEFAAHTLIPQQHRLELLQLGRSATELLRFARRIGIAPGIVVGQLQHLGRIPHNHFNGLKRRYEWE